MKQQDIWGINKYKRKRIAIIVIAALIAVLTALKQIPFVSEYVFARGFSRAWIFIFGSISSLFPFSVFEIFIIVAVIYVLYCIATWIICACKKQSKRFFRNVTNLVLTALSVVLIYTAVASPAYMRESRATVPLYEGRILDEAEVKAFAQWYLTEINALAAAVPRDASGSLTRPYSFDRLTEILAAEYSRFDGGYLSAYTPRAKQSFMPFLWDSFGVAGVTFAPLGECVIAGQSPLLAITISTAHEIAHTKGVMRENDANLTAYYVTFNSGDDFVRYCSMTIHLFTVQELLKSCPGLADFSKEFEETLHEGVNHDLGEYYYYYFNRDITWLEQVGMFFNNLYLELSGAKKGTDSYYDHGGDVDYTPGEIIPGDDDEEIIIVAPPIPVFKQYSNVYKMVIGSYLAQS